MVAASCYLIALPPAVPSLLGVSYHTPGSRDYAVNAPPYGIDIRNDVSRTGLPRPIAVVFNLITAVLSSSPTSQLKTSCPFDPTTRAYRALPCAGAISPSILRSWIVPPLACIAAGLASCSAAIGDPPPERISIFPPLINSPRRSSSALLADSERYAEGVSAS
jgi:hypothetical protein